MSPLIRCSQRLHKLEPDPATAGVVPRIFAAYLGGSGLKAIAEALTGEGIPSPSANDPARNPHRCGIAWSWGAVGAALGHTTKLRWNEPSEWSGPSGLRIRP